MLRVVLLMVVVTSGFWLNDIMESSQPKSYRGGSDLASSLKIFLQTKTSITDSRQSIIS